MIRIFKILLPTMFPIVIPAFPFNAELILTAASGILVPMATMVSPTTSWGIPNRSAIPDAPSTNQSAPFTSIKKPNTSNNTCKIISILFSSCFPCALEMSGSLSALLLYRKRTRLPPHTNNAIKVSFFFQWIPRSFDVMTRHPTPDWCELLPVIFY